MNKEEFKEFAFKVPYLIKFQGNEKIYAETLLHKGELFMRSIIDHVNKEVREGIRGQGDANEGLLFGFMRCDCDLPVYCLYSVYQEQIENGYIRIDKRVLEDFCSEGGYLTVFKSVPFVEAFYKANQYGSYTGLVSYKNTSFEQDVDIFCRHETGGALFYKKNRRNQKCLSYQNEFRIVVSKKLKRIESCCDQFETFKMEIGDTSGFAKQYSTDVLIDVDENSVGLPVVYLP